MAEIAVLVVFDIQLQASSQISMRNRFVYDGWVYNFINITPHQIDSLVFGFARSFEKKIKIKVKTKICARSINKIYVE